MKIEPFVINLVAGLVLPLFVTSALAQSAAPDRQLRLQQCADKAAQAALQKFAAKKLAPELWAFTLVDLRDPEKPLSAGYRGDAPFYPASVVKLFYLEAAQRWLEEGKLAETDELRRALRDMIVDSSNDATHYVVDALTGTTGGPELPEAEMAEWSRRRNSVNRYFGSVGYTDINVNQKPWNDGPYGREKAFLGKNSTNRNRLTTDATARLLTGIVTGRAVTAARSAAMMKLLERAPSARRTNPDDQSTGFIGGVLPPGSRLWSKAGWTSTVRHDAAYVELPDGGKFVLVIFTLDHAREREIIPGVAKILMESMRTGQ